jgi:hypothetical protein
LRARPDGTSARLTGPRRARIAALVVALVATIGVPVALAAETRIDGSPIDVWTNGLGQMQFRYDGFTDGVFYHPTSNTPSAGLAIAVGNVTHGVGSGTPLTVPEIRVNADGSRTLHSVYTFAFGADTRTFEVTEDVTYKDGTQTADVSYAITNVSTQARTFRAALLADLYVSGDDRGTGVEGGSAPSRFVGGQSAGGSVTGLTEITPWSHFQEGEYGRADDVFASFEAGGLTNKINPNYVDNTVGAEWDPPQLAAGATFPIQVRWLLGALPAPLAATPTPTPTPPPPPPPTPVPPPVPGRSVNLKLLKAPVLYKLPGTSTFLTLTEDVQIPVGTTLDTTDGRVSITAASDLKGATSKSWFYSGVFKVSQALSAKPITELALAGAKPSCTASKSASAAAKKPKTRKLWGDGSGQFRTRGQFSSATVRGTKWVVIDRCDGTLTRVARGVVTVRDFRARKTIIVRAGKQYLARAKTK